MDPIRVSRKTRRCWGCLRPSALQRSLASSPTRRTETRLWGKHPQGTESKLNRSGTWASSLLDVKGVKKVDLRSDDPSGETGSVSSTSWLTTGASLVAQEVKKLPAMQDTQVRSLGREDPLEKGLATYSSILGASQVTIEEKVLMQIPNPAWKPAPEIQQNPSLNMKRSKDSHSNPWNNIPRAEEKSSD